MFAIDLSPLVFTPRTGVARALDQLLLGWARLEDAEPLVLLAPGPLDAGTHGFEVRTPAGVGVSSARAFRRRLPRLVRETAAHAFLSPWSACPRLEVPVVAVVHELPFVRHGPIEGRARALVHRAWLRRNVRECAALITPSRATAQDVLALHPQAEDRVHVIPHGFDPTPWEALEDLSRDRPSSALMVGLGRGRRGAHKKGLDLLLEAWEPAGSLPALVLVGTPALSVPEGARVVEGASDEALRRLVAEASVLAYPSRSEGFGYPLLEAMAAGTPVVCSDAGSIPEVVGEAAACVPSGRAEELRERLRWATRAPTDRPSPPWDLPPPEVLVAAGRERARQFPPVVAAARVQAVLRAARASA